MDSEENDGHQEKRRKTNDASKSRSAKTESSSTKMRRRAVTVYDAVAGILF
jgi:hypothetical protein